MSTTVFTVNCKLLELFYKPQAPKQYNRNVLDLFCAEEFINVGDLTVY